MGAGPNHEVSFIITRCNKYGLANKLFSAVVAFVLLVLESITNVFARSLTNFQKNTMASHSVPPSLPCPYEPCEKRLLVRCMSGATQCHARALHVGERHFPWNSVW